MNIFNKIKMFLFKEMIKESSEVDDNNVLSYHSKNGHLKIVRVSEYSLDKGHVKYRIQISFDGIKFSSLDRGYRALATCTKDFNKMCISLRSGTSIKQK